MSSVTDISASPPPPPSSDTAPPPAAPQPQTEAAASTDVAVQNASEQQPAANVARTPPLNAFAMMMRPKYRAAVVGKKRGGWSPSRMGEPLVPELISFADESEQSSEPDAADASLQRRRIGGSPSTQGPAVANAEGPLVTSAAAAAGVVPHAVPLCDDAPKDPHAPLLIAGSGTPSNARAREQQRVLAETSALAALRGAAGAVGEQGGASSSLQHDTLQQQMMSLLQMFGNPPVSSNAGAAAAAELVALGQAAAAGGAASSTSAGHGSVHRVNHAAAAAGIGQASASSLPPPVQQRVVRPSPSVVAEMEGLDSTPHASSAAAPVRNANANQHRPPAIGAAASSAPAASSAAATEEPASVDVDMLQNASQEQSEAGQCGVVHAQPTGSASAAAPTKSGRNPSGKRKAQPQPADSAEGAAALASSATALTVRAKRPCIEATVAASRVPEVVGMPITSPRASSAAGAAAGTSSSGAVAAPAATGHSLYASSGAGAGSALGSLSVASFCARSPAAAEVASHVDESHRNSFDQTPVLGGQREVASGWSAGADGTSSITLHPAFSTALPTTVTWPGEQLEDAAVVRTRHRAIRAWTPKQLKAFLRHMGLSTFLCEYGGTMSGMRFFNIASPAEIQFSVPMEENMDEEKLFHLNWWNRQVLFACSLLLREWRDGYSVHFWHLYKEHSEHWDANMPSRKDSIRTSRVRLLMCTSRFQGLYGRDALSFADLWGAFPDALNAAAAARTRPRMQDPSDC